MNATPEAIRRGGMPTLGDGRRNSVDATNDVPATKKSGWGQLTQ